MGSVVSRLCSSSAVEGPAHHPLRACHPDPLSSGLLQECWIWLLLPEGHGLAFQQAGFRPDSELCCNPSAMSNPPVQRQSIMCTFWGELSHTVAVGNVSALIVSFNIPETHCQGGY